MFYFRQLSCFLFFSAVIGGKAEMYFMGLQIHDTMEKEFVQILGQVFNECGQTFPLLQENNVVIFYQETNPLKPFARSLMTCVR